METLWLFVVAIGPLLLIAAIYFGFIRNRRGSWSEVARAERGARELREEGGRDPAYKDK